MIAVAAIGLTILALTAVFMLPGRAQPPAAPQPEDDEGELRAQLTTMDGGQQFADQPGPLPAYVAAIARDALRIAKCGPLPEAMRDPAERDAADGEYPWPDDTKAYRRRIYQLGEQ